MREKNKDQNADIVPNDGTYIGAKKGKALKEQKIKEDFDKAWSSQKILLKNSQVKLYKDKANIALQLWKENTS